MLLPDSRCLDEDAATALVEGRLASDRRAAAIIHIDSCSECRTYVSHLVRLHCGSLPSAEERLPRTLLAGEEDDLEVPVGGRLGRYVVLERIGAGGMGIVYAAYDPQLDRRVALKVLRSHRMTSVQERSRLVQEAKAMARVPHANVVAIYDVDSIGDRAFIVMEFASGGTLRKKNGSSWSDTLSLYEQVARGLSAIHNAGLIHRDFKPENALVRADGSVCVSDFGLATLDALSNASGGSPSAPPLRSTAVLGGTTAYMSPEQRRRERIDERSDQYAFCVSLYETLYGGRPPDPIEVATGAPATDASSTATVPDWLRVIVVQGLSARAENRHASMDALIAALGRGRRPKRVWIATATVGLVALAAALALVVRSAPPTRPCDRGEAELVGTWNAERRATVLAVFGGIGTAYSRDAGMRVAKALDEYANQWRSTRRQACEGVVAHTGPEAIASDARIVCLDRRRRELSVAIDELNKLSNADESARAVAAVESLGSVSSCLRSSVPPTFRPHSATDAERAENVESYLAKADVLEYFEKEAEAEEFASKAVREAQGLENAELMALAFLRSSMVHRSRHAFREASEDARRAISAADAAGDDPTRVRAWGVMVMSTPDAAQATEAFEHGMAVVSRIGDDDSERYLRSAYGWALSFHGRPKDARNQVARALALVEVGDKDARSIALQQMSVFDIRLGDLEAANRESEQALSLAREALGEGHPQVAMMLNGQANIMLERKEAAKCLELATRARDILDAAGSDAVHALDTRHTMAEALLELDRPAEALPLLRELVADSRITPLSSWASDVRADLGLALLGIHQPDEARVLLELAVQSGQETDPPYLAEANFALARALTELHGDPSRARALTATSLAQFDALDTLTPLERARRDAVQAWLSARP